MATRSILAGCGAYLPDRVIDNNELATLLRVNADTLTPDNFGVLS